MDLYKGAYKKYKDRGISRDLEILEAQEFHDEEVIGHLQEDDAEGVQKTPLEI